MKNLFLLIMALSAVLCGCKTQSPAAASRYQTEFYGLFDTVTVIIGYAESEEAFTAYANVIHKKMGELHKLYDIYNEYEGINNLCTVNKNAGVNAVAVSQNVIDLLLFAREGCSATGGAVNMAMGSVLKIWHNYRESGINFPEYAEVPPMEMLTEASRHTSIENVVINDGNNTVFITDPEASIDVGALAKAYAEGLAVEAAKEAGMASAIISAGGNITTVGKPMDTARDYWNVGVQDPDKDVNGTANTIDLTRFNNKTMAVSGSYERYYEVEGKMYHHIINPETLMPAGLYKQVAVIHAQPSVADLLSTALFIMPFEDGKALAESMGADALWIGTDGEWLYTDGYAVISKELN